MASPERGADSARAVPPVAATAGFARMVRHFWPHLRPQRRLLVGSLLALIAETLLRLLEPWPLKLVFDGALRASGSRADPFFARYPWLGELGPIRLVVLAALLLVAFTSLRALCGYVNLVGFARLGNQALARVRAGLYQKLHLLSLSFHNRARAGDLVVRVTGDVAMLQEVAVTAFLPFAGRLLLVAGVVGMATWMNWRLALVAAIPLPLLWLRTRSLGRQIRSVAREQRQREGRMAATAAESLAAIRVIQSLAIESSFEQSFHHDNEKSLRQDVRGKRLSASLERSVDVLIALSTALTLGFGAHLVLGGRLSAGDLLVFLAYLKIAYRPVQDFAKYTGRLAKATAAGERVLDLLEMVPEVHDRPGAVAAPPLTGAIRFEQVSFAYQPGHPVLDAIDLEVKPGQTLAIVGASGCGKTTLLSLLARLYEPTAGRILLDGRDTREYTLESLRSQIGTVLQENLLFAMSVRDNIAQGLPQATDQEVEAAARMANAHDFITAMPEGYASVVGERGVTLSQGQRQRIAIARAAIARRPILVLDEPATGLDERNQREVGEALARLARGRTTLLVTHSLRQAMTADQIVYLSEGRIAERGRHDELMALDGAYAASFRLQSGPMPAARPADVVAG